MTEPFQFSNGQLARNGEDLIKLCQQFPDDATNYLVREDFEKWLAYIGESQFAQCAATARQSDTDVRQKLETFVNRCQTQTSVATPPAPATTTSPPSESTNSEPTNQVAATSPATPAKSVSTSSSINATNGSQTPPAETAPESPKVSLLAIISQFIYNLLSNRGRAKPDSLKSRE